MDADGKSGYLVGRPQPISFVWFFSFIASYLLLRFYCGLF